MLGVHSFKLCVLLYWSLPDILVLSLRNKYSGIILPDLPSLTNKLLTCCCSPSVLSTILSITLFLLAKNPLAFESTNALVAIGLAQVIPAISGLFNADCIARAE